ncbi:MAG: Endolytic murein transglycosylase [Steroidobacteraceae bacterium]|nr:Endolytic murein transglycosylase [Steroidobacteraceae bacterium]
MKRLRVRIALLVILAVVAWFGLRQYEAAWLATPLAALQQPVVYQLPAGASLTAVAVTLAEAGWLDRPRVWVWYAKWTGAATRIKAGEYLLQPGTTPAALLHQFVTGAVLMHTLTIPEGWTFRQALAAIQVNPAVSVKFRGLSQDEVMKRLGLPGRHPEGMFFPDTYRFPRGTTDRELLQQAQTRLEEELASAWKKRKPALPLRTPYEALILASLVEKETGEPDERPLIASVFVKRLRIGMRLQTDPSVIYGIGESFDGDLRRRDLQTDTPYNSYTRAGLPPTPIALVGRAALEAAVRPAATDALYFVATGKGDGRHFFANSLVAHNLNVARHLANLRGGSGHQVR